jgi:catechol 2,3-dioxygenase-like lactoylglutathione lyase family enzyme
VIGAQRVDFIAVPVSDLARADEFYGQTLGLGRNPNNSGERWVEYETGNLTIALSQYGGGIGIRVGDVDEARRAAESEGLEFSLDTFDSGVCHGAPFQDPDGNPLLLHHRYAPLESWSPNGGEVQRTDFIGVNVRDRERSAAFYRDVVGLQRNPLSHDEWPEFDTSNVGLLLSTPEQKGEAEFEPKFSIALRVPDVATSMERLQAKGVEFEFPDDFDSTVCHMAFLADPDGNRLILHHRYAPYSDGSQP